MKTTYVILEDNFHRAVKKLQQEHKCKYSNLKIENDASCCGAGSIYPKIVITCKICNKWWIIFRGSQNMPKTSPKIRKIINHMIETNIARCWLKDKFELRGDKIRYEER